MRKTLHIVAILIALLLGASVLAGCTSQAGSGIPDPNSVASETTETSVFYSTGRSLFEERVVVDAKKPYRAALDKLLAARPQNNPDVAIVQPQATVKSVTVKNGVATVDWGADVLDFQAEPKEKLLAWAAVLRTFGEFSDVKKVEFTVDGKKSGTAGGKDIQAFWGSISLRNEPWPVLRRSVAASGSASANGAGQ